MRFRSRGNFVNKHRSGAHFDFILPCSARNATTISVIKRRRDSFPQSILGIIAARLGTISTPSSKNFKFKRTWPNLTTVCEKLRAYALRCLLPAKTRDCARFLFPTTYPYFSRKIRLFQPSHSSHHVSLLSISFLLVIRFEWI